MGPEIGTKNDNPFHNLRVSETSNSSKFEASKLPDSELEQLWHIAVRRGFTGLYEEIEAEKAKRGG